MTNDRGWVGVDLDGTLAHYEHWTDGSIGPPIPAMAERVKYWVKMGQAVRIFTARISTRDETERSEQIAAIGAWCKEHLGFVLPVTCEKDFAMIELWDDRVVAVEANTGKRLNNSRRGLPEPPREPTT